MAVKAAQLAVLVYADEGVKTNNNDTSAELLKAVKVGDNVSILVMKKIPEYVGSLAKVNEVRADLMS